MTRARQVGSAVVLVSMARGLDFTPEGDPPLADGEVSAIVFLLCRPRHTDILQLPFESHCRGLPP